MKTKKHDRLIEAIDHTEKFFELQLKLNARDFGHRAFEANRPELSRVLSNQVVIMLALVSLGATVIEE